MGIVLVKDRFSSSSFLAAIGLDRSSGLMGIGSLISGAYFFSGVFTISVSGLSAERSLFEVAPSVF